MDIKTNDKTGLIPWEIDVPVLLIFFNRPGCFSKVFEQVKIARPRKLFLYQDGAREGNEKDIIGVQKCREIALDIDWDCEIHTLFQEKNYGCDPSEYIAQKWAFDHVDKCIILEDDDVPSQSFFPFCTELLDRYENDQRINMICGMNNLESWDSPYSYLFTETGSIWGWATWKRVVDEWEPKYDILTDDYNIRKLSDYMLTSNPCLKERINVWNQDMLSSVEHYEAILCMNQYSNNRLNIVPTKNMIINVGNTPEGSTHSMSSLDLIPSGLRRIYTMKSHEIGFPLKHPKYVINDVEYQKQLYRVMGWGHPLVNMWRKLEKSWLIIRYEGISGLFRKLQRK